MTDEQFEQINRSLPPEDSRRGRPPKIKNREALEGILHILRTGMPWRDLPKDYGRRHTIYMRWQRWIDSGIWPKKGDQALGRCRGGLTTKIHLLCASEADAVEIRITAGQVGDAPVGAAMIEAIDPRDGIEHAAMDKAYDSNDIRTQLDAKM